MDSKELKSIKDGFMKEMVELTGFNQKRLKEILAAGGYQRFDHKRMSEYKACILAAHHRYEEVIKKTVKPLHVETPCPIPGCKGVKVEQGRRTFLPHWKCSDEGARHAIAWEVAKLRALTEGVPEEKFLETQQNYAKEILEYLHDQDTRLEKTQNGVERA